jgi:DUF4097 and DUF4098 domain-containing protein YvlB
MRLPIQALTLALLAGLACAPLFAATPIDQARPLDPRGRIEIENLKGRIQVRAWERNEVRITGTLGDGVEKLVVEGDRDHLVVRVQYPKHIGAWRSDQTGPTDLQLQVPLQADLDIESVSADIDIDGVAPGDFDVNTVSGGVVVAAAPKRADINSVSGDLRLTLNTAEASAETVSGDIVLVGRLDGEVHAETVSGDITIDSRGQRLRRLSTGTVSGDAQARVGLVNGGEIKSETVSGDIRLRLPKTLSARVSGESFSGDLDAPGAKVRKEEFGPGKSFEARYGSGAGEIRMETFSGDAELILGD